METKKEEIVIVGVGASAGGLEALQLFVKNIPDNTNIAYVIAQHLSPTYKSLMATLLSKETEHKVLEAKNGLNIKPDHLYICPPNKNITINDDIIYLKEPVAGTYGPKPSIDILFDSLSASKGEKAAGIILSGTGSDGSRGIRAIKAEGGYTIAQDPENAKYDGMPLAAINTGNIDLILKPEEMGAELPELFSGENKPAFINTATEDGDVFKNILNKLQSAKSIDFSQYKINTIQRRIERRMAALRISSITNYNNHLKKNPEELEVLFSDILIGVTSFFRDADAFMGLKDQLGQYLEKKSDRSLRIWAPGCSTGEEAYSIAMVISEILGADIAQYKIQIFATDIDETATNIARKGLYPESALIDLDKSLRNKYFVPRKEQYEVIKPVREMVIFSRHDIIKDPPFLKLDTIVCRNLLIYFNSDLQKKLFPIFHYALNDSGLLFLGKSETVGHFQTHFLTVDKKWKIYCAAFLGRKAPPISSMIYQKSQKEEEQLEENKIQGKKPTVPEMMVEKINQHILPTCIVINENMDIVYVKGDNPYIVYPEGTRNDNVFRNIRPVLSTELRAAIHYIRSGEKEVVKTTYQKVTLYGEIERYVRMIILLLQDSKKHPLYMACFQEEVKENLYGHLDNENGDFNDERIGQLELDLARTKEHLQTVIEELETNNEEMQSLNEELQSSNEELQSSNEELETTNEELQSTNEELQTAYTELKATYDEKEDRVKQYMKLQTEMERNQERFNLALEANKLGIFDYHLPIRQDDYWSEGYSKVLGYLSGELPVDKTMMTDWLKDRIDPADVQRFDNRYQEYLQGKCTEYKIRFRIRHKDGNWRWVEQYSKSAERGPENELIRTIGVIRDITNHVNDECSMRLEAMRNQVTNQLVNFAYWEYDVITEKFTYDKTASHLLGLMQYGQSTSDNWIEMIEPAQQPEVKRQFRELLQNNHDLHATFTLINDGSPVTINVHAKYSKEPDLGDMIMGTFKGDS